MGKIIQNTKQGINDIQETTPSFFESVFKILNPKSYIPTSTQRGVSLLELLIYVALLSGLMVVISDAFISLSKGRGQAEARSEVNSAIRFAGDIIKQDIKNASAVSIPTLSATSSSLSLTVGGATVLYNVSGGVLNRTVGVAPAVPVTGGAISVDAPVFTRFENNNSVAPGIINATTTAIQAVMTMRYNASGGDWQYADTLRTTATLR